MSESEMKLSERSEFFISGSAFNQILRPLFFSSIQERRQVPAPRVSVPFYPGSPEYFPVFLNSSSFHQLRISDNDTHQPSIGIVYNLLHRILKFHLAFVIDHGQFIAHSIHDKFFH